MNKHTKQFIEDAIEGGWEYHGTIDDYKRKLEYMSKDEISDDNNIALLDPLAWEAVYSLDKHHEDCWACDGKKFFMDFFDDTKLDFDSPCGNCNSTGKQAGHWKKMWHSFIDHLADGKSIEEALKATSK